MPTLRGAAIACWRWGRVATSTHSPPVRRRVNRGTSSLRAKCRLRRLRSETRLRAQRSALRLFLHRASRDCAAIACWWWGKVATSTHSPPVRRRANRGTSSLCAPAVFAPRFARLRGDSRAGKKITFPQKRKSQKEAPDTAWGRNTAPWVLSQQDKPSRMDTMAQFTLSHMILIIVPCRGNGVNTTRNVAPRGIFCIFVSTFGQYVKTACKPLFSQRNISCRPSIFAAAIAALPLFYQRQHRTIPALRLKHRSGSCRTSLAVSALRIMRYCPKQNSGPSLVGKAAASDNPLSCVLFHLRGAISSFCAAYRITFYLRQSAGRYNCSVLLLRQPTLYHPC